MYTVSYTLYTVHFTLYTVNCALYTILSKQCSLLLKKMTELTYSTERDSSALYTELNTILYTSLYTSYPKEPKKTETYLFYQKFVLPKFTICTV